MAALHTQAAGNAGGWLWGTGGWQGGHLSNGQSHVHSPGPGPSGSCGRSRTTAGSLSRLLGDLEAAAFAEHHSRLLLHRGHRDRGHGRGSLCRGGKAEQNGTDHRDGNCPRAEGGGVSRPQRVWGRLRFKRKS